MSNQTVAELFEDLPTLPENFPLPEVTSINVAEDQYQFPDGCTLTEEPAKRNKPNTPDATDIARNNPLSAKAT